MKRKKFGHGFSESTWDAAKEEARQVMTDVARRKGTISYSDLVYRIKRLPLDPHGPHLAHMLGEISSEENDEGRGLLTVVVVHKTGDMKPGHGFFELARSLGYDTADEDEFWIKQLRKVHDAWST